MKCGTGSARSDSAVNSKREQNIADLSDRLERAFSNRVGREKLILAEMKTTLDSRSPVAVLARGYCVAEKDGAIVEESMLP